MKKSILNQFATNTKFHFCFFCLLLLVNLANGQKVSELKLENKISILNDRANLVFPAEAKNIARDLGIMAADPNINKETRVMMDFGQARIVFFALELFKTTDKNLLEVVNKQNDSCTNNVIATKNNINAVISTPTKFNKDEEAILIKKLYVKSPDNSLFLISAYVNPEGYKKLEDYQKLSEKIFSTIELGKRILNFSARKEVVPVFENFVKYEIDLPHGYLINKDKKYDFEVLKFQRMGDVDAENWISLLIYFGRHPSLLYRQYGFKEEQAYKTESDFLNKSVTWLNFKNDEEPLFLREQKIEGKGKLEGLTIHISMQSNNQKLIDELTQIVKSFKEVK